MSAKGEKSMLPAYVSYSFFIKFINGLRETHLPLQIDKSLMRTASGSQQSSMLASLRFLRLIDEDGKPTELMKQLVEASDQARPPLLKKMVESSYTFLFGSDQFPLDKASGQQVVEKFRDQELTGSTVSKAIAFFLAIAKAADIKVSPHVKAPAIVRSSSKRGSRPKDENDEYDEIEEEGEEQGESEVQKFQIPIPGKPSAMFSIPKHLEDEDWEMLKTMLDLYIARMRKQQSLV